MIIQKPIDNEKNVGSPNDHAAQHLAALVEGSSDAIITKSLDGIIRTWNGSAERIFGYAASEIIGKPVTTLFPDDHRNEEIEIIARIRRGERVDHYETIRKRKDGTLVPISLTISPIKNSAGQIVAASKIVRDISAQKAYEKHLIAKTAELEQFAYIASHDLREPLRKIAVYAGLLLDRFSTAGGPEATKYALNITNAVTRMEKLVGDLLSYSRADHADLNFERLDLRTIVTEVINDLEIPIKESNAKISLGEIPAVMGNHLQMYQLLQNLISNAVKFRGNASPVIVVSGTTQNDEVVVSVRDNGIGIDAQYRERVFRIFQKLHSASRYPGTGIGLAICKKIVEKHGGRIWMESSLGQGTTFSFALPSIMDNRVLSD